MYNQTILRKTTLKPESCRIMIFDPFKLTLISTAAFKTSQNSKTTTTKKKTKTKLLYASPFALVELEHNFVQVKKPLNNSSSQLRMLAVCVCQRCSKSKLG